MTASFELVANVVRLASSRLDGIGTVGDLQRRYSYVVFGMAGSNPICLFGMNLVARVAEAYFW